MLNNKELHILVQDVESLKQSAKELKKKETILKDELEGKNISEKMFGDIKVTYKDMIKSTVDEERLINIIQDHAKQSVDPKQAEYILSCIKFEPKIDEDKLQELCYHGAISPGDLEPAYSEKVTKRLTVMKVKTK